MPVCDPGSLPGFVGTVTTVAGRGSPAEWEADPLPPSEIPYLVDSPPPTGSPGARSGPALLLSPPRIPRAPVSTPLPEAGDGGGIPSTQGVSDLGGEVLRRPAGDVGVRGLDHDPDDLLGARRP